MTKDLRLFQGSVRQVPPPDDDFLIIAIVLVAIGAAFLGSVW